MEDYIQQSEGASLIKCGSSVKLASSANSYLQNDFHLQNIISDILSKETDLPLIKII